MASHLRSIRGMGGNHAWHLHAFGLLVVVYVSTGRLHETACEAASLARTKLQALCWVVCLTDLKTPTHDLRRFKEASNCNLFTLKLKTNYFSLFSRANRRTFLKHMMIYLGV